MSSFKESFSNVLIIVSTVLSLFVIGCIVYFDGLIANSGWNIISLLLLFSMCLNPITCLFRHERYRIKSVIYYLLLIPFLVYELIIVLSSIIRYYQYYSYDFGNSASLYISNYLLYMVGGTLFFLIFSFFFKKEKSMLVVDNTRFILFLLSLVFFSSLLGDSIGMVQAFSLGAGLFSFLLMIKWDSVYQKSELQKIYFLLGVLSFLSFNMVAIVLIVYSYMRLDYYFLSL